MELLIQSLINGVIGSLILILIASGLCLIVIVKRQSLSETLQAV